MTALAMILGMLPMALGLGEGGEQNAPLGRAVIGGLLVATFVTLFVVPVVYSLLRKKPPTKHVMEKNFEAEERGEEPEMTKPAPKKQGEGQEPETAPKRQGRRAGAGRRRLQGAEMTHNPSQGTGLHPARLLYVGGALLVVLLALVVGGLAWRHHHRIWHEEAALQETQKKGPRVQVATAKASPAEHTVTQQGEARAFAQVTLYAKVSGYLRDIRVDKGDPVKEGQIVAIIESPEIDKQYDAAMADARNKRAISQARAGAGRAGRGVGAGRGRGPHRGPEVADAHLAELSTQRAYETIRAPLLRPGHGALRRPRGAGAERHQRPDRAAAGGHGVAGGPAADLCLPGAERTRPSSTPGTRRRSRCRSGRGSSTWGGWRARSGELDPRTRTMLVEVDMDNRQAGRSCPAASCTRGCACTPEPRPGPLRGAGAAGRATLVALIGPGDRVHFSAVPVASDDGQTARLLSGLNQGERVALSLGDDVQEGGQVQPVMQPAGRGGQGGGQQGGQGGGQQGGQQGGGQQGGQKGG